MDTRSSRMKIKTKRSFGLSEEHHDFPAISGVLMMKFAYNRRVAMTLAAAVLTACASASTPSTTPTSTATAASATSAAITAADLRHRLFIYADDSLMGRKAGTPGNDKATQYIADE